MCSHTHVTPYRTCITHPITLYHTPYHTVSHTQLGAPFANAIWSPYREYIHMLVTLHHTTYKSSSHKLDTPYRTVSHPIALDHTPYRTNHTPYCAHHSTTHHCPPQRSVWTFGMLSKCLVPGVFVVRCSALHCASQCAAEYIVASCRRVVERCCALQCTTLCCRCCGALQRLAVCCSALQ